MGTVGGRLLQPLDPEGQREAEGGEWEVGDEREDEDPVETKIDPGRSPFQSGSGVVRTLTAEGHPWGRGARGRYRWDE